MNSKITNSNFEDLKKTGNGGAIEIQRNDNVHIKFCFFRRVVASRFGGAFYLVLNSSFIKKTCFVECFSSNLTNEVCGNAGYAYKGSSYVEHLTTHKCGPSETQHSDSSVRFNSPVTAKYVNASVNYGVGGGASISVVDINETSRAEYCNVISPHDNSAIESCYDIDIINSNFINTTTAKGSLMWCDINNTMKFDSCIFIDVKNPFSNGGKWEAVNCQADTTISSITLTTPKSFNFRVLFNRPLCTKIHRNFIMKHTIKTILFIFLVSN